MTPSDLVFKEWSDYKKGSALVVQNAKKPPAGVVFFNAFCQRAGSFLVLLVYEGESHTTLSSATSSSDTVNIIFERVW